MRTPIWSLSLAVISSAGYPASPAAAQPLRLDRKLHTEFTTGCKTLICCCERQNTKILFLLLWDELKVEVTVRELNLRVIGGRIRWITSWKVTFLQDNCEFCFPTQLSQHSDFTEILDFLCKKETKDCCIEHHDTVDPTWYWYVIWYFSILLHSISIMCVEAFTAPPRSNDLNKQNMY